MEKLHFSIVINASREKVWHAMLDDEPYREWTTVFNQGSYYEGSWERGSKILFLGPDPRTGKIGGMVSRIADSRPYEFVSIEHLGLVENGVEDTESEEAKKWAPSYENYTFKEVDGGTEVLVDVDSEESMAEEFSKLWPAALEKLKTIAER
jgi:hypothetical protein